MTRDTAKAIERDHKLLTPDELDAVSGGMRKAGGDPSGAGKVHFSDFSISKTTDKSSPLF